jgi:hypothetical protein
MSNNESNNDDVTMTVFTRATDILKETMSQVAYNATMNQVQNKRNILSATAERDKLVKKRGQICDALKKNNVAIGKLEELSYDYKTLSVQIADKIRILNLLQEEEVRYMYVNNVNMLQEDKKVVQLRNIQLRKDVKNILLTKAECMRMKKAEIQAKLDRDGHSVDAKMTKVQLCDIETKSVPSGSINDVLVNVGPAKDVSGVSGGPITDVSGGPITDVNGGPITDVSVPLNDVPVPSEPITDVSVSGGPITDVHVPSGPITNVPVPSGTINDENGPGGPTSIAHVPTVANPTLTERVLDPDVKVVKVMVPAKAKRVRKKKVEIEVI